MTFRRFLPAVACAALALISLGAARPALAQDATAVVLAERAELDKAVAADTEARIPMLEKFLSDHPQSPATYKRRLGGLRGLSHVTIEVETCPHEHAR